MSQTIDLEVMTAKLMEKFKALKVEATEDVAFDKANLESSFDSTIKITKWLNKRSQWTELYRSYEFKRNEAWKRAYEYYRTEYRISLENKEEYRLMIATDPNYSALDQLTKLVSEIIDYIDGTIDNLKNRRYEVRNLIDWLKFNHGS